MIGTEIAGFRVVSPLRRGGQGEVYLAEHSRVGTLAVVKLFDPRRGEDHDPHERLVEDLRAVGSLHHPAIVPVLDVGEYADRRYVVTLYVRGTDLARELASEVFLGLGATVELLEPIAAALDACHAVDVVHGDVKPANILLGGADDSAARRSGRAYLTDFAGGVDASGVLRVATLRYAAPEVIASAPAGPRADVYAFACVVFECLTGRAPYLYDVTTELVRARAAGLPHVEVIAPHLPKGTHEVFERALAESPEDRFPSCGVLLRGLMTVSDEGRWVVAVPAPPIPAPIPAAPARPDTFGVAPSPTTSGWTSPGVAPAEPETFTPMAGVRSEPVPAQPPTPLAAPAAATLAAPTSDVAPVMSALPEGTARDPVRRTASADAAGEPVDCSVFAPVSAWVGDTVLVQVFAHLVDDADRAAELAVEFDSDARRRVFRTLEALVPRGALLTFELTMGNELVADPVQRLVWTGTPQAVQFEVELPGNVTYPRSSIGTVTVTVGGAPLGHLKFKLRVESSDNSRLLGSAGAKDARVYERAFASYASEDRTEVLERVQMLRAVGIDVFQDVLVLDPGDRWERRLFNAIDECDLFLLFWSTSAEKSEWVRKEAGYALERQGGDEFAPPEIKPVLLDGPPITPPWPELHRLHFDDKLRYFMRP